MDRIAFEKRERFFTFLRELELLRLKRPFPGKSDRFRISEALGDFKAEIELHRLSRIHGWFPEALNECRSINSFYRCLQSEQQVRTYCVLWAFWKVMHPGAPYEDKWIIRCGNKFLIGPNGKEDEERWLELIQTELSFSSSLTWSMLDSAPENFENPLRERDGLRRMLYDV